MSDRGADYLADAEARGVDLDQLRRALAADIFAATPSATPPSDRKVYGFLRGTRHDRA